tara:strand:+ start:233 stop:658 length:426 start_codon:yes stop_codon:yes gene_type:complete
MKKEHHKELIVAVSGYFDPLHVGHLEYFQLAKQLGDKLYVIVNNDVQAVLKKQTSFMNENDRLEIIKSLSIVDNAILSIDQDKSVSKTLEKIKPDIFGNGGDRIRGSILEEDTCIRNNIKIVDQLGKKIRSSSEITGLNPK